MNAYFLSLLGASLAAAMIGLLAPAGTSAGLGKTLRLLTTLVLLCVIVSPLPGLIANWNDLPFLSPEAAEEKYDFDLRAQETLDAAARAYFARALTERLEEKFGFAAGEVRCAIEWSEADGETMPKSVTLILSGGAKWKNPREAETYVSELLGCPCDSAID